MPKYKTVNFRQRENHPDILIEVSSEFEAGFEWLLSHFETLLLAAGSSRMGNLCSSAG